ncbi:hypothetical protein PRIPAC_97116 [Pristionchus pacificus]|uniref:Uncharacterized protein n=1 Tax=Pristionchus pacificus TaxID=54126 RepID=A0A2A6B2Y8_PRIPA|nr:hypothetical protein PRIPAC_97116 [Pristionchus pacificus]|eukprot:PDM60247.1 hypothetical protein PRIPAC_54072 [Pristionchus pacificus]
MIRSLPLTGLLAGSLVAALSTAPSLHKNKAGKFKPHHIGVRKSWLTWHSQNLEGFRQSQPLVVAQDEIVRRFIRGFFPQNLVVCSNEYSNRLDIRRIYWMLGFAGEFLSQLLKQPVKLELAFVESEKDCAYNFI